LLRLGSRLVFHTVSYASFASLPRAHLDGSLEPGVRPAAPGEAEKRLRLVLPLGRDSYRSFGYFAIGLEWASSSWRASRLAVECATSGARGGDLSHGTPGHALERARRRRDSGLFVAPSRRPDASARTRGHRQRGHPRRARTPLCTGHRPLHRRGSRGGPESPRAARRRAQPRPSRRVALERYVAKRPRRSMGREAPRRARSIIPRWVAQPGAPRCFRSPQCARAFSPVGRAEVFSPRSVLSHRFRAGRGVDS